MRFIAGMLWKEYKYHKAGWVNAPKIYRPDLSTWGKACELSMSKWLK